MLKTGPSLVLKTGPSFFTVFPIFIVFFGHIKNTNSVTVCQNSVFAKFWGCQNEVFEKKIAFFVFSFYVGEIQTEKEKMEKAPKPYKIVFVRLSSQNVKNRKNDF